MPGAWGTRMNPPTDSLTVLRARGRRLAKLVHPGGRAEPYDSARRFDMHRMTVADLDALARVLARLLHRPDCCAIRGAPIGLDQAEPVRRLLYTCRKTGELPTVAEQPRQWLALDMEGIPLPPEVPASALAQCAALAIARLPSAFAGVRCVVQATAGHGFKPDLRLRLWFWCSRPMDGGELKRWLRGTPADPSVFGAVQPIYTAAPLFAPGCTDPLPERMAMLDGTALVRPPSAAALAPAALTPRPCKSGTVHCGTGAAYARAALVRAVARITGGGPRHPAIISEARSLARLIPAGLLTERELRAVLEAAAMQAGKDDAAEITACITWGLAHPAALGRLPEGA